MNRGRAGRRKGRDDGWMDGWKEGWWIEEGTGRKEGVEGCLDGGMCGEMNVWRKEVIEGMDG